MQGPLPAPAPVLDPYSWRNISPNANLHYIRNPDEADMHIAALDGPVGFDLEWKPVFTKNTPENPVALVQLANRDTILLIQVSAMREFPEKLKEFLESPDFVKAGVAIHSDAKKLYNDWQVSMRNCVELSFLARSADNAQWKGKYALPLGLARLIEVYEKLALPKGKIQRSNWENYLTPQQLDYAANDAHSGFLIYERLMTMTNSMQNVPQPVYYTFDVIRGNICEPSGAHWNCHNPDYDPGPPPPPKEPKPPTAREIRRAAIRAIVAATPSTATPAVLGFPTEPSPLPGAMHYHNPGESDFTSQSSPGTSSLWSLPRLPQRPPLPRHILPPTADVESSVSPHGPRAPPGTISSSLQRSRRRDHLLPAANENVGASVSHDNPRAPPRTIQTRSGHVHVDSTKAPVSVSVLARAVSRPKPTDNAHTGPDAGNPAPTAKRRSRGARRHLPKQNTADVNPAA